MPCQEYREALSAYADGFLQGEEKAALETHLAACPACAEALRQLRTLSDGIGSLQEEPPADLHDRILQSLRQPAPQKAPVIPLWVRRTAAAAAVLVILCSAGIVAMQNRGMKSADTAADCEDNSFTYQTDAAMYQEEVESAPDGDMMVGAAPSEGTDDEMKYASGNGNELTGCAPEDTEAATETGAAERNGGVLTDTVEIRSLLEAYLTEDPDLPMKDALSAETDTAVVVKIVSHDTDAALPQEDMGSASDDGVRLVYTDPDPDTLAEIAACLPDASFRMEAPDAPDSLFVVVMLEY